jgi:hypothetical protein
MQVRAKFRCNSIVPGFSEGQKKITLNAVYGNEGENADYSKYTPSGNLDILIDGSTKAVDFFEQGKDYYLDFSVACAE